MYVYLYL